jgi:hypothetical protein
MGIERFSRNGERSPVEQDEFTSPYGNNAWKIYGKEFGSYVREFSQGGLSE